MRRRSLPAGPVRRHCRPAVEGLEGRRLPAAGPRAVVVHIPPTNSPSFDPPASPVKDIYHEPLVPNLALIPNFVKQDFSYSYPTTAASGNTITNTVTAQPTPSEIAREYFLAKFSGRYDIYPGRFGYQALTVHALSHDGGSNQFLHGTVQFAFYPPKSGAAEQLTGVGTFVPKNYLQASDLLIFDITPAPAGEPSGQPSGANYPAPAVDGLTLPTHLHWYFDTVSSGGYTTPLGFTQGGGYLDIAWIPDKTPVPGTLGSGRMVALWQGLLNTSSILNSIEPTVS